MREDPQRPSGSPDFPEVPEAARTGPALQLGLNLAVGMGVFTFIGHYIGQKRGGGPGWTIGGMFVGLAYGAYEVWKVLRLLNQPQGDRRNKPPNAPRTPPSNRGSGEDRP